MTFDSVIGHKNIKKHLLKSIETERLAHTQLFIGAEGSGVLPIAIAYANEILCLNNTKNVRQRCEKLIHPDLHFVYPVASVKSGSNAISTDFAKQWREFLFKDPYQNAFDWFQLIGLDNKQGFIGVDEADDISSKMMIKSFEGGYKVMIIWYAELMNVGCANKLLKLLEEPPSKTIFILIAEDERKILQTIYSRCQITKFNALDSQSIENELVKRGADASLAKQIAYRSQGNIKKAFDFFSSGSQDEAFEKLFIHWVRTAFRAKGNKEAVLPLLDWSQELSQKNREEQKQFLNYCLDIFRQALLLNYGIDNLIFTEFYDKTFKFDKFSEFITPNNIFKIQKEIEDAILHIERNANSKVVFTDLSIKLTRFIHSY